MLDVGVKKLVSSISRMEDDFLSMQEELQRLRDIIESLDEMVEEDDYLGNTANEW